MPIRRRVTKKKATKKRAVRKVAKKATKKRAVRKVAKKRAVRKVAKKRATSAPLRERRKLLADAHLQFSNAHRSLKKAYLTIYKLNDVAPDEGFLYGDDIFGYLDLVDVMGETENLGYLIELIEELLERE
jgi:hypothetical protein